jgi:ribonuclease P protein component
MKRVNRLRGRDQFQRLRRSGRRWEGSLIGLNGVATRRRHVRCGFVVAKRIGIAVIRNRVRRRLREAVRLTLPRVRPGWDLIFIARSNELASIDFAAIRLMIENMLRRANLLIEEPAPAAQQGEP